MPGTLKIESDGFSLDKIYTAEEFLPLEDLAFEKHELRNGKVIKKPDREFTHNIVAVNTITALGNAHQKQEPGFVVLTGDTKIYIPNLYNVVYPDVLVLNEPYKLYHGSETVITNPLLVVEVFSPSTESHDRTSKFNDYKQVPSFKEYLLISQKRPYALASFRNGEGIWEDAEAKGLESSTYLKSIDCTLDLKKIYKGVSFELF